MKDFQWNAYVYQRPIYEMNFEYYFAQMKILEIQLKYQAMLRWERT